LRSSRTRSRSGQRWADRGGMPSLGPHRSGSRTAGCCPTAMFEAERRSRATKTQISTGGWAIAGRGGSIDRTTVANPQTQEMCFCQGQGQAQHRCHAVAAEAGRFGVGTGNLKPPRIPTGRRSRPHQAHGTGHKKADGRPRTSSANSARIKFETLGAGSQTLRSYVDDPSLRLHPTASHPGGLEKGTSRHARKPLLSCRLND